MGWGRAAGDDALQEQAGFDRQPGGGEGCPGVPGQALTPRGGGGTAFKFRLGRRCRMARKFPSQRRSVAGRPAAAVGDSAGRSPLSAANTCVRGRGRGGVPGQKKCTANKCLCFDFHTGKFFLLFLHVLCVISCQTACILLENAKLIFLYASN